MTRAGQVHAGCRPLYLRVHAEDAVAVVVHVGAVGRGVAAGVDGGVIVVAVPAAEVRATEATVEEAVGAAGAKVVTITI